MAQEGIVMTAFAIWRRLDTPGHDAALLTPSDDGWSLRGAAVFNHARGPACVNYGVDLDTSWRTRRGTVQGFVGGRRFEHLISRDADGWRLDGVLVDGLAHLSDLDYGFTPATNLQQLRRLSLAPGQAAELAVVWFDVDADSLTQLPQRYERRSETSYWYAAPSVPYEGLLELAENGFAQTYPGLWRMES
jgi:uncharacterized protein